MIQFKVWLSEHKQIAADLADTVRDWVPKTHKMARFVKTRSLRDRHAYVVHTQGPGENDKPVAHYVSFRNGSYHYLGNSI